MRVLHIISGIDPENGGPTAALRGLARAQVDIGLDVSVVSTWKRQSIPGIAQEWAREGVKVKLIGPARGALSRHPQLTGDLERLIPEHAVVHIHALWEDIQHRAARIAAARQIPYLIRPCGGLYQESLRKNWLQKRAYRSLRLQRNLDAAAAIHFSTDHEAQKAGVPIRTKTIIEPNGVDLDEFSKPPPQGALAHQHSRIGNRPIILFLGRVHPEKGLELLIPAMAHLRSPSRPILIIAGPGIPSHMAAFARLAEQAGVTEDVLFVGMLSGAERQAALNDATLLCLPSFHENFGLVVIEALAAGKPVVVSDHVGLHTLISGARVGGVVPLNEVRLAEELDRWLDDHQLYAAAQSRARPLVEERFDWRKIAVRWVDHYRELTDVAAKRGAM